MAVANWRLLLDGVGFGAQRAAGAHSMSLPVCPQACVRVAPDWGMTQKAILTVLRELRPDVVGVWPSDHAAVVADLAEAETAII